MHDVFFDLISSVFLFKSHLIPLLSQPLSSLSISLSHLSLYLSTTQVKNPKPMTIPLALSTSSFCLLNGWLQAHSLLHHHLFIEMNFKFYSGVCIFLIGWYINITSDWTLIHLRKNEHDKGYYIPHGGLFE